MIVGDNEESLKPSRSELTFLAWAFGISLAIHLLTYGTYTVGKQLGWWKYLSWPTWLKHSQTPLADKKDELKLAQQQEEQSPTMFIETTPIQAVAEVPKDAKYYSDKNTAAANPDADKDTDIPKIDGTQTHVAKTEDTPRHAQPLKPSLPAPELRARPKQTTGDLAFNKPKSDADDQGQAEHARPRTLLEAQEQSPARIAGQKMKQDGGVKRHLDFSSVDAKNTSFGAYDQEFFDAVSQRWQDLIDDHHFVQGRQGHVTIEFVMNYDGRITDVNILDNDVGEMLGLLCQKALLDPAPFAAWPSD
ncbi:MAG TPA: hypothetical protein VH255_03645, partial [Verrucomicrobiae bacterium]|nr:hypothetical protein [Verrucomicrobiae bacterium]